jgi:hypothetical protein
MIMKQHSNTALRGRLSVSCVCQSLISLMNSSILAKETLAGHYELVRNASQGSMAIGGVNSD